MRYNFLLFVYILVCCLSGKFEVICCGFGDSLGDTPGGPSGTVAGDSFSINFDSSLLMSISCKIMW